ncbi:MAG: hypothetical protein ACRD98_12495 [Nitrososphaera sp.]
MQRKYAVMLVAIAALASAVFVIVYSSMFVQTKVQTDSDNSKSTSSPKLILQPPLGNLNITVAQDDQRVDLVMPTFSNPTNITNPLFPISNLHSAILLGNVEGEPFRTETTLLPDTRIIEWEGQKVETLVSQYVAFIDGRIEEVALDHYAQADDGSVWYFGEDVFNYEDGVVADTEGTWFAGKDGPAALIMPSKPKVGDVFRPENIPNLVFEEVTITSVDLTVDGPLGPVYGAILSKELHMDGFTEDKYFAPGYGEFSTGTEEGDLEAIALVISRNIVNIGMLYAHLSEHQD